MGKQPGGGEQEATEYTFNVTSGREAIYSVTVLLPRLALMAWAESHGRPLADSEQYAAVKLRLFRAFDQIANLASEGRQLLIESDFLEESLASLGVD